MKQTKRRILAWLMTVVLVLSVVTVLTPAKEAEAAAATAVSTHGKLAVKGTQLVDKNGQPFQIHGVSTHGLQWFGQYNNKAAYQTLRDDWGANAIRLAMYVDEGGYYSDRNGMKKKVIDGVQYATELGMYAIIDWHLLNVNPKNYTSEAKSFFKEMAQKYKNYDNVIYEICNEPSNCPWSDIKSYATEVIQTIRAYDKDAIIIVGTPTWSQLGNQGHTYEPADDPIRGYSNLMYAFHFYASESSHNQWLTAKIGTAIDKELPVFVSEFGLSEASGNGNVDLNKAAEWMKRCDDRNVSYCVWSLCNKNESSALIKSSCGKTSGWNIDDLTKAGQFIRNHYRSRMENTAENNPEVKNLAPNITVSYKTHVQTFGWENEVSNGKMAGTVGSAKRLEGITIRVSGDSNLGIRYKTHVQSYGWQDWKENGVMSGTTGEAKRLEAICIELTGANKDKYDVYYRVHAQTYGWLGWAKNGAPAGTAGYAKRLEGIQIVVVKRGMPAPEVDYAGVYASATVRQTASYIAKNGTSPVLGSSATTNANPTVSGENTVNVAYRTHVQTYGWQGWKYNGQMSGTSGQAKRLEGICIKLTNKPYSGNIVYTTHVQTYGWEGNINDVSTWKQNGVMSGTSGRAKRLEAICINLTGEMAAHYDVYYRVHAQTYGWLGWSKNGAPAGTAGMAKRLEGIQIVLVPKNGAAPSVNYQGIRSVQSRSYIQR